jgi:hypothetical protein
VVQICRRDVQKGEQKIAGLLFLIHDVHGVRLTTPTVAPCRPRVAEAGFFRRQSHGKFSTLNIARSTGIVIVARE